MLYINKTAANKSIGKSWADGRSIGGFSLLSCGSGGTSNAELFVLNFNKIFSIISGCGQTEVYFPAFANTRSLAATIMEQLIFIDTNIFLDFYRIRNSDVSMKYLDLIDKHKDRLIFTDQVAMEFKKHRLETLQESLKLLKPIDLSNATLPTIISESEPAKISESLKKQVEKQNKELKNQIYSILENPNERDKVYQTLQRLSDYKNPKLNLNRKSLEFDRIYKLSLKRFFLGYPPRKKSDTSIGDALNWEWIIECCKNENRNVVIVSRDLDYGVHFDQKSILNDSMAEEFRQRVSNNRSAILTNKLSVAFKMISTRIVTKEMEKEEKEVLIKYEYSDFNERKSLKTFMDAFKDGLIDLFKEENNNSLQ